MSGCRECFVARGSSVLHQNISRQGVIDAFCVVVYPRDNLVVTARIAVARCSIPLWSDAIAVTPLRCDERRQVFIVLVQTYAVIPIPSVEHRLTLVLGDTSRLMERGVVGFTCSIYI